MTVIPGVVILSGMILFCLVHQLLMHRSSRNSSSFTYSYHETNHVHIDNPQVLVADIWRRSSGNSRPRGHSREIQPSN